MNYVSPSAQQTFGHDPDALLEHPFSELVEPDDVPRVVAFVASIAALPPGQPANGEFRLRHADGRWRDVEALATNLLGDESIDGDRAEPPRHQRAQGLRGRARAPGLPRHPHRAAQPRAVPQPRRARARQRSVATRLPVAVLFLDVDDFKNVNDSLGHAAGDDVLQEVGRRLEDCMRPVDTAARLGGDEFAVLIHDAESELQAVEIAHRVMSALAAPIALDGRAVSIATSVGIAFSDPGHGLRRATPRSCCATPTRRCTWPRRAARATTRSSSPRCTRRRSRAWSSRPTCSARSKRASSRSATSRSWTSSAAIWPAWRRSCAGSTPRAAPSRRSSSSPCSRTPA